MLKQKKIPFINENTSMNKALKIMTKKLGTLIARKKKIVPLELLLMVK